MRDELMCVSIRNPYPATRIPQPATLCSRESIRHNMSQGPAPVPAATILMLRDGDQGLEIFMVVRHHQVDFASGALVFPGGRIDAQDGEVRDYCEGVDEADDTTLAFWVGAIREAFEESGILLARPTGQTELVGGERLAELDKYRDPLNAGELGLKDFLESERLILACDLLQHFAHWTTPEMMPKRFDTHFYLAAAPLDHLAVHDGHESVDSVWIAPQEALAGARSGKYTIIFPTRLNVEMLGLSQSVAEAMQMAQDRTIVRVMPWTEKRDDGIYLCIPAAAGYSLTEEKFESRPD